MEFPSPFFDEISSAAKEFVRSLLIVQDEKRLTAKMVIECFFLLFLVLVFLSLLQGAGTCLDDLRFEWCWRATAHFI